MDEKLRKVLSDNSMEKYIVLFDQKGIDTVFKFKKLTSADSIVLGIDKEDRDIFAKVLENIPNEEYSISGKLTLQENRYFTYSLLFPKFIIILMVVLSLGLSLGLVMETISLVRHGHGHIFPLIIPLFAALLYIITGSLGSRINCVIAEDSIKIFTEKDGLKKLYVEYKKGDMKKIILKGNYVLIKIGKCYLPIVERYFEDKTKYNEFINMLKSNYERDIVFK
jgi:hypothetical protein